MRKTNKETIDELKNKFDGEVKAEMEKKTEAEGTVAHLPSIEEQLEQLRIERDVLICWGKQRKEEIEKQIKDLEEDLRMKESAEAIRKLRNTFLGSGVSETVVDDLISDIIRKQLNVGEAPKRARLVDFGSDSDFKAVTSCINRAWVE